MRHRLLVPEILELLSEGRREDLVQVLRELHPKDAAEFLSGLDVDQVVQVMTLLPIEMERDLFTYLDTEVQESIVRGSGRERVKALLAALPSDDRAGFLESLDERIRDYLFPLLTRADREDLIRRERYEDDQVGAILNTDYCVLDAGLTAPKAVEAVRRQAPGRETIYYSYVVDEEGKLVGFVSLRELIMARARQTVGEIMRTEMVSISARADQEEAVRLIRDYDLIALPVTDDDGRLIGIITHDDAADIAEEEDTEDMERMAGITGEPEDETYVGESALSHLRRRLPYVVILAVTFMVVATVIQAFEETLAGNGVLIALLPMVMATGGNVGGQAAALVVRGLALKTLEPGSFVRVLWKELRIGVGLAVVLAVIVFFVAFLLQERHEQAWNVCGAVALAMTLHVVTAAVLGGSIPILVQAARMDPALVSHPALTTIADLSGAVIYLFTVSFLLGLPR